MDTSRRLYIGNLPYNSTGAEIRAFFLPFKIVEVKIITDRETGKARGFAFVALERGEDLQAAVAALNGKELGGRCITVNEARQPTREVKQGTPPEPRKNDRVKKHEKKDEFSSSWPADGE